MVLRACLQCRKEFEDKKPLSKPRKFCSQSCYWLSKIGKEAPTKGRKYSFKERPWQKGTRTQEQNGMWKGAEVRYRALHKWVERILGKPHKCEHCKDSSLGHRQYHWANKSRNYQRIATDWIRLCAKCHFAYDNNRGLVLK